MTTSANSALKRKAALASVATSAAMCTAKLVVGLLTGSIAILSEAAQNFLDLGATLLTFFAIRVSDRPADETHPYGHGKVESVAALSETVFLVLTSVGIVWEAVGRLASGAAPVTFTWYAALVIGGSIAIDLYRVSALRRVAKLTQSPALEADAMNFESDIWSSAVVLGGLGLVSFGWKGADSLAAIAVAIFICTAGVRLGRRTIATLVDRAPEGIAELVRSTARRTPGVVDLGRVRARLAGTSLQIEVEAGVSRRLTLDRVADVRRDVASRIQEALPESEISVSTFPVVLNDETMRERIILTAAYHGHAVHHVTVQHLEDRISISLDIEIDAAQSLARAHDAASRLEAAIIGELGGEVEVETHIEPLMPETCINRPAPAALTAEISASLDRIAAGKHGVIDTHDVRVREGDNGLFISFHCTFAPSESVERVHETVSMIETELRQRWQPYRIIAHAEPPEDIDAAA